MGERVNGYSPQERKKNLVPVQTYDALFVDVDSCLVSIEGIDYLGKMKGVEGPVADLTARAMNGDFSFDEAVIMRLTMTQPTRADLIKVSQKYIETITPGAREALKTLQMQGVKIHILSSGYTDAIYPLADELGIRKDDVHANVLYFDAQGGYRGFNKNIPLAHAAGKREMVKQLIKQRRVRGSTAIVGDATSELETYPYTNLQIGFLGHVTRQKVEGQAPVVVYSTNFLPLVPLVGGREAVDRLRQSEDDNNVVRLFAGLQMVRFNERGKLIGEEIANMQIEDVRVRLGVQG